MKYLRILSAAAWLTAAGCHEAPTTPSVNAPFSQVDLTLGAGAEAAASNTLSVHYTGWLYDPSRADRKGLLFDSSIGGDAFSFQLGVGQVIAGWDQGLPGMKVGGTRRLVIPPSLGYGAVRNQNIPPYSTLVFDVELLEIK